MDGFRLLWHSVCVCKVDLLLVGELGGGGFGVNEGFLVRCCGFCVRVLSSFASC